MFLVRMMLFPFAILYDAITRLRNRLYDLKIKPSVRFDVPVICVGNLSVGGTGKTPVIEYLIRFLSPSYEIAVLSRGYKRKTSGFRIATNTDTALTLGDEPYQLFSKFGSKAIVAVGEDRAMAIPTLLQHSERVQVILLDDGFQHRRVNPSFSIILTEFGLPFYHDYILPAGRLRESRSNAQRAQAVIVTKCPISCDDHTRHEMEIQIQIYTPAPVYFTTIRYSEIVPFGGHGREKQNKVVLVTGIGSTTALREYVQNQYTLVGHLKYPDHHHYTIADLTKMESALDDATVILTTEKDMVKLSDPSFQSFTDRLPFFYLPMEVVFIKDGKKFEEQVLQSIEQRE